MRRLLLVSGVLIGASALHAVEVVRRDLQFSLGATPTEFDYTIDAPGGSFSGSDAFDFGWQARLGGRWALTKPGWSIAPVIGGDLSYATSYASDGELACTGLGVTGGLAWAVDAVWSADVELGLGYQRADLDFDGGLSGTGDLFATDLRVRGLRLLDRTWSIDVEVGWQFATGSLSASQGRDIDLDISGWTAGVMIVWRGAMRPAALE